MKFNIAAALVIQGAVAFPSMLQKRQQVAKRGCTTSKLCDTRVNIADSTIGYNPNNPTALQKLSAERTNCGSRGPCLGFNEADQAVSFTGEHAWAAPTKGQIRGQCPGLNAAANHGYLSRSGVSGITDTIEGLGAMYNFAADIVGFLAAYAIAMDGDLITMTWSIGGPQPANLLGGLLGQPRGTAYSHNNYEGDTSIGRCDAYTNQGDAHSLSINRFKYAFESGLANNRYTLDLFAQEFTKNTFRSIQQNAYYFAPLFSTTLVAPAAYNLVIGLMSNHSAEEPNGYLDAYNFQSFFSVAGEYPNFKWVPGWDRMPDNWYRRPTVNAYTAADVVADLLPEFTAYPDSFRLGGNTNGVNTYEGVDIANLTGGTYNSQTLFQGDNFACFFFQAFQQAVPDQLKGGVNDIAKALALITQYFDAAFGGLSCPQLAGYDGSLFTKYTGNGYSPTGYAESC